MIKIQFTLASRKATIFFYHGKLSKESQTDQFARTAGPVAYRYLQEQRKSLSLVSMSRTDPVVENTSPKETKHRLLKASSYFNLVALIHYLIFILR